MRIPTEPLPLELLLSRTTSDMATVVAVTNEWLEKKRAWETFDSACGFGIKARPVEFVEPPSPASQRLDDVMDRHIEHVVAASPDIEAAAVRLGINAATIYRRRRARRLRQHAP